MVEKVGDVGSFKNKLEKLVESGYLASNNIDILETALDAGHASAHRSFIPDVTNVNIILDIVENLIQVDILKEQSKDIKKTIPKRKK